MDIIIPASGNITDSRIPPIITVKTLTSAGSTQDTIFMGAEVNGALLAMRGEKKRR